MSNLSMLITGKKYSFQATASVDGNGTNYSRATLIADMTDLAANTITDTTTLLANLRAGVNGLADIKPSERTYYMFALDGTNGETVLVPDYVIVPSSIKQEGTYEVPAVFVFKSSAEKDLVATTLKQLGVEFSFK